MLLTILATIVVLGVLILVHELGHFWAAKAVGIGVPRFSIGLGPKLWGFKRGETEYVVSWLPLGGYVKMQGMGEETAMAHLEGGVDEDAESSEGDFETKPLWARTMVITAGVFMNLVFAVAAFAVVAWADPRPEARVGEVSPGTPAAEVGIQPGDLILSLDGRDVERWEQVVGYVRERPGESIRLTLGRNGDAVEIAVTPQQVGEYVEIVRDTIYVGQLGVTLAPDADLLRPGAVGALVQGWNQTAFWVVAIFDFLKQLFTGETSARELGGPILIGQISGAAARAGIWSLLNFMAVISVNLAILNLLPIPVLDGGWLVFLGIEGVRGKALSVEQRIRLTQVGMLVVVGIMVWAIGNDILRLFGI